MSAATATPAKKEEKTGLLATVANNARQYGIVGALLVIVVAFEVLTGGVLLKPNSFVSLIQQNAYVIILAIGMVMVIIATHIDLSVGSLVAFIGGVCALLMERAGVNWMLAIVIALVVGLIVGVWQGFWVAVIGIPGFITTLAGMLIFRGLATVIVGESVPITSLEFRGIARNYLPNILGWWGPFDGLTIARHPVHRRLCLEPAAQARPCGQGRPGARADEPDRPQNCACRGRHRLRHLPAGFLR